MSNDTGKSYWVFYSGVVAGENIRLSQRKNGQRFLNPRYRIFKNDLTMAARSQWKRETIQKGSRVSVIIIASLPKRMDMSNIIKPVYDALQAAGVFADDLDVIEGIQLRAPISAKAKTGKLAININISEISFDAILGMFGDDTFGKAMDMFGGDK